MSDDRFLAAFLARPRRILGRQLRPFSMRHRLTLEAIGSPFVAPTGARATVNDLILAVRICSFDDPLEAVSSPSFGDYLHSVKMRLRPGWFEMHLGAFEGYIREHATHPPIFAPDDSKRKETGLHWTLTVATALIADGFPEERVWSMSESLAVWYYLAGAVRKGADLEVLTTELEERLPDIDDAIAEAEAKVARQATRGGV